MVSSCISFMQILFSLFSVLDVDWLNTCLCCVMFYRSVCVTSNHLCLTPELTRYCLFAFQTLWRGTLQMAHQVRFLSFLLFWVGVREREILYCYGHGFLLLQIEKHMINNHNQKIHVSDISLWHNKRTFLHLLPFVLARFIYFFQLSRSHFSFKEIYWNNTQMRPFMMFLFSSNIPFLTAKPFKLEH